MENNKQHSNISSFEVIVLVLDCLLVAYIFNSESIPIQIGFIICFIYVSFLVIRFLLKEGFLQLVPKIKSFANSKCIHIGSLLVIVGIFLPYFIQKNYLESVSYVLFGISEIVLIVGFRYSKPL